MVTGIIVTHGNLAEELLETAKTIYGDFTDCHSITNEQKSPQALTKEIEMLVESIGNTDGIVILTDFFGGSCSHACLGVEIKHTNVRLVTGVNLPMLLAFLYRRGEVSFEKLPGELVERGLKSIQELDPENL
jgi:PTS system mannose-specific IIA component/PTS system mannose-specific IIB component